MIENPAGDAQGILAAAEQLAFGRQTTPVDGRRHDLIPFSSRIDAHANSVLWILVTGTTTQARVMRRLIRWKQPFCGSRSTSLRPRLQTTNSCATLPSVKVTGSGSQIGRASCRERVCQYV